MIYYIVERFHCSFIAVNKISRLRDLGHWVKVLDYSPAPPSHCLNDMDTIQQSLQYIPVAEASETSRTVLQDYGHTARKIIWIMKLFQIDKYIQTYYLCHEKLQFKSTRKIWTWRFEVPIPVQVRIVLLDLKMKMKIVQTPVAGGVFVNERDKDFLKEDLCLFQFIYSLKL